MFSLEIPRPLFNLSPKKHLTNANPKSRNLNLISQDFDDILLLRLKPLLNGPVLTLKWLTEAVDLLSMTHAEAEALISKLGQSRKANLRVRYLDTSLNVLDVCNSISSEIVRLQEGRLFINFVVHLISGDISCKIPGGFTGDRRKKAINLLSDWRRRVSDHNLWNPAKLIGELAGKLADPPRGKITSVERLVSHVVYTVEVLTVFMTGVLVNALTESVDRVKIRFGSEFCWSDSLNTLDSVLTKELMSMSGSDSKQQRFIYDLDCVETRVVETCEVMVAEGDVTGVVKELGNVNEVYNEGLDHLLENVNRFFRIVLRTRDGLMGNFKAEHLKVRCGTTKK